MNDLQNIGSNKMLSVINDPFKKSKVTMVYVCGNRSLFDKDKFRFSGTVKFENGNTKGEQEFEGESFDDVVLKIKAMLETME